MKDGVYYDLDEEVYHALPRLSASGIKHLMVSPMDFWIRSWLNPNRRVAKKRAFDLGKAYDRLIIDGKKAFHSKYAVPFNEEEYPDALTTTDTLKEELALRGLTVSGNKPVLIKRLRDDGFNGCILDEEKDKWLQFNQGKEILSATDYDDVINAGLFMELQPNNPFKDGTPQVSVLWTDEETGVPMKARYDYMKPRKIIDLKTFSNSSGHPINIAVARSIATYKYYVQMAVYMDSYFLTFQEKADFQFIFIHSGATLLAVGKDVKTNSLIHQTGHLAYRRGVHMFAEYYRKYGSKPWSGVLDITPLSDDEMPMWVYDQ